MHIAVDARFLGSPSYGLAQYSENLLVALSRLDSHNRYTIFVNSRFDRRLKVGENFTLVPVQGRPLSAKGLARLQLALRRVRPDLIHVHFPLAPIRTSCPAVITVHDTRPFARSAAEGMRFPVWDRIGGAFLYPMTMRRAKWIVCVSKATRDQLVDIFPDLFHKTIVLASGVEDEYREPLDESATELIASRLAPPERYIFYSGSAGKNKNIPRMIEAFATLRQRSEAAEDYHFVLDLSGDMSAMTDVERTIGQFGLAERVRVLTEMNNEQRQVLFRGARALFMASLDEGFGLQVLKAQLSRSPVVAADSGALPEVCGEGAVLIDPENLDQMVTVLEQVLFDSDLREFLVAKGEDNVRHYSWQNTAERVKQIYELLF